MNRAESLVFDRAVDYYDRTRSLSRSTMARILSLVESELGGGPCLEIGVGTGRVALPLWESGVSMIGADLSEPMLRRLVVNAGGGAPFPLVVADATRLPFAGGAFAGALGIHILHLIPRWEDAVRELARVVGGGAIVVDLGRETKGPFRELLAQFAKAASISQEHRGINDPGPLDELMAGLGREPVVFEPIIETRHATYSKTIAALEAGTYSITWAAGEAARRVAGEVTRRWAAERFGDLDRPYDYHLEIALRSYRAVT